METEIAEAITQNFTSVNDKNGELQNIVDVLDKLADVVHYGLESSVDNSTMTDAVFRLAFKIADGTEAIAAGLRDAADAIRENPRESQSRQSRTETVENSQNSKVKELRMALNLACPVGTVDMSYAAIKEQVEAAGIDLNKISKLTVHHVRTALGIESTGGVNPVWSRPAKEELCQN